MPSTCASPTTATVFCLPSRPMRFPAITCDRRRGTRETLFQNNPQESKHARRHWGRRRLGGRHPLPHRPTLNWRMIPFQAKGPHHDNNKIKVQIGEDRNIRLTSHSGACSSTEKSWANSIGIRLRRHPIVAGLSNVVVMAAAGGGGRREFG